MAGLRNAEFMLPSVDVADSGDACSVIRSLAGESPRTSIYSILTHLFVLVLSARLLSRRLAPAFCLCSSVTPSRCTSVRFGSRRFARLAIYFRMSRAGEGEGEGE